MYGLIWNTPQFLVNMALIALKQERYPYEAYVLKNGFEKIWTTIIEKDNINVKYNTDIIGVVQGAHSADLHIWRNSKVETERCGFLVWTLPMSEFSDNLRQLRIFCFPASATRSSHQTWSTWRELLATVPSLHSWRTYLERSIMPSLQTMI